MSKCPQVEIIKLKKELAAGVNALCANIKRLKHRLEWYETRFKPPVQPPTKDWMALLDSTNTGEGDAP